MPHSQLLVLVMLADSAAVAVVVPVIQKLQMSVMLAQSAAVAVAFVIQTLPMLVMLADFAAVAVVVCVIQTLLSRGIGGIAEPGDTPI